MTEHERHSDLVGVIKRATHELLDCIDVIERDDGSDPTVVVGMLAVLEKGYSACLHVTQAMLIERGFNRP